MKHSHDIVETVIHVHTTRRRRCISIPPTKNIDGCHVTVYRVHVNCAGSILEHVERLSSLIAQFTLNRQHKE